MRERRHHGRLSSKFLPPQTSLYNAMQAIIGAGLRERYDMAEQLPSDLERLLEALKDAHSSFAKPPGPSSSASGTGGETPGAGGASAAVGVDNRRSR
jgi:hypothetical protein